MLLVSIDQPQIKIHGIRAIITTKTRGREPLNPPQTQLSRI